MEEEKLSINEEKKLLEERIIKIRQAQEHEQRSLDILQGEINNIFSNLKEEYGVETIEAANSVLKQLSLQYEQSKEALQKEIDVISKELDSFGV